MAKVAKNGNKIREVAKKRSTIFYRLQKRSTKFSKELEKSQHNIFLRQTHKFGTISCAPSSAQSAAPSSAHQRGRASGVVDGTFPYWVVGWREVLRPGHYNFGYTRVFFLVYIAILL